MKDEDVSSGGANNDPFALTRSSPAASSAGASSPAIPVNAGSVEWLGHGQASKGSSRSHAVRQPPRPSLSTSAACYAPGSMQVSCRPWERGDLLRRLSTFNPSNWFAKPKGASSLVCARRGWINIDLDKIECESCGATVKYSSSVSGTPDADATFEEFAEQLDGGHRIGCPWRGNICPESLVQFPPAPPSALVGGFKDRCDGLLQFSALPVVSAAAVEQMQDSCSPQMERFLSNSQNCVAGEMSFKTEHISGVESFRDENIHVYFHAQKLISLCGWESRWSADIQDCEEHSAQSARNGNCSGPAKTQKRLQDPGPSRRAFSTSTNKDVGRDETYGLLESKCESRSPLLDCSLCGATVRIWDFLTISRPARFAPNGIDLPENSKKLVLTRGVSAASGISGWFGTDGVEKERADDPDEAATTGKRILPGDSALDLNLTMAGGVTSREVNQKMKSQLYQDADLGRDLKVGQPAGSEVGDRAISYESRGPGTRKRSAEEGGSTVDRPPLQMQHADSVEGTVIDREGDEVYDSKQYSAGPSKRVRSSDASEAYPSSYRRDSSDAGPSRPVPFDMEADTSRVDPYDQVHEQFYGFPARDSAGVSSVIAMDTVCHSTDDDSLESVENFPVDADDANFPSSSAFLHQDLNDASELNYSNQAQQSACFQPAAVRAAGEAGVSSTNDGDEEVVNTEALTTQVKGGISFGISGGSVGMGASYEAEIHGADLSVHRSDSVVGDAEPVAEVVENQGQTGEFAPDQGQTDNFIPDEMDREDPHGDSQDVVSHLAGRADSGSKIVGSVKTESVESGEKAINMDSLMQATAGHPSLSCNAVVCSGYEASKEEVTQTGKASPTTEVALESGFQPANAVGPIAESNYEGVEFDPIKHHNAFCPWVNRNVAAAGSVVGGGASSTSGGASSSNGGAAEALSGWQLTLDALDAFQTLGNVQVQTVESESAASRHKDDRLPAGRNILSACHSFSKSRGRN